MTDAHRLPSPDDPFWTEAPLRALFAPLTSERIKPPSTGTFHGNAHVSKAEHVARKSRKKWERISDEKREEIVALARLEVPYIEIAARTGVNQTTCNDIARQAGVSRKRGRVGGGPTCAVPGCGKQIARQNQSGVCKGHRCVALHCRCKHCVGAG